MFFNTEYGQLLLTAAIICIATWGTWLSFNAGSFLMGQGAVMGVAGYGAGYAYNNWQLPFVVALLWGVLLGGIFGVLLGLLRGRLGGIFFGMATLGLSSLFVVVIDALPALGGPLGLSVDYLISPTDILLMFAAAFVFMLLIVRSSLFRRFIAIGDDSEAASSSGVRVRFDSVVALGLSGLLGGLAGVAYVFYLGSVTPGQFSLDLLVELLVALIVGGFGTVLGPILGSAVVVVIPYESGDNPDIVYGIAILVIMLLLPSGLLPRFPRRNDLRYLAQLSRQGWNRRDADPAPPPPEHLSALASLLPPTSATPPRQTESVEEES